MIDYQTLTLTLQLCNCKVVSIFSANMSIFLEKEIIFYGFKFVNFANAGCENGCFLRYRLLAPCLAIR